MNRISFLEYAWLRVQRVPRWAWVTAGLSLLLIPALLIWLIFWAIGSAWNTGGALLAEGRDRVSQVMPEAVDKLDAAKATLGAISADTLMAEGRDRLSQVMPEAADKLNAAKATVAAVGVDGALQAEMERAKAAAIAALPDVPTEAVAAAAAAVAVAQSPDAISGLLESGKARFGAALTGTAVTNPAVADVSGEDVPGVTRMPGSVRTAFARDGDEVSVSYSSPSSHREAIAFYRAQLEAEGYAARVMAATTEAETVAFHTDGRTLTLSARAQGQTGSVLDWEVR